MNSEEIEKPKKLHPWFDFLEARRRCINCMAIEEGKTDEEIFRALSMDGPSQVFLIRTHPLNKKTW